MIIHLVMVCTVIYTVFCVYRFVYFLDINECMEDPNVCPRLSDCINMLGSYKCNCISGYHMNTSGLCTGKLTNNKY